MVKQRYTLHNSVTSKKKQIQIFPEFFILLSVSNMYMRRTPILHTAGAVMDWKIVIHSNFHVYLHCRSVPLKILKRT